MRVAGRVSTKPLTRRFYEIACQGVSLPNSVATGGHFGIRYSHAATDRCVSRESEVGKSRQRRGRVAPTGKLSATCLLIALTGCAHTQYLTRSCITQAQYEQLRAAEPPKVHDKLTGNADEDIRPITGSAIELRAWGEAELETLKICSEPPQ